MPTTSQPIVTEPTHSGRGYPRFCVMPDDPNISMFYLMDQYTNNIFDALVKASEILANQGFSVLDNKYGQMERWGEIICLDPETGEVATTTMGRL